MFGLKGNKQSAADRMERDNNHMIHILFEEGVRGSVQLLIPKMSFY